jgi:hypothetical protein
MSRTGKLFIFMVPVSFAVSENARNKAFGDSKPCRMSGDKAVSMDAKLQKGN